MTFIQIAIVTKNNPCTRLRLYGCNDLPRQKGSYTIVMMLYISCQFMLHTAVTYRCNILKLDHNPSCDCIYHIRANCFSVSVLVYIDWLLLSAGLGWWSPMCKVLFAAISNSSVLLQNTGSASYSVQFWNSLSGDVPVPAVAPSLSIKWESQKPLHLGDRSMSLGSYHSPV